MGCAVSRNSHEKAEDDVVSLCRERKKLMKSAVNRRYSLAEAHFKYNQSLCAVALAIRLFVARHSSPSTPFVITSGPTSETYVSDSTYNQKLPSLPDTHQAEIQSCSNLERENVEKEDEEEEDEESVMCEHFYDDDDEVGPLAIALQQNDFGWDFFNPFDGVLVNEFTQRGMEGGERSVVVGGNGGGGGKSVVEEVKAVVGDISQGEKDKEGVVVIPVVDDKEGPTNGRELLEALKDVEDHFLRVYDSNLDVCKLFETNVVQLQSGLEQLKGGVFMKFY